MMTSIFAIVSIPKRYFMLKAVEYRRDAEWALAMHSLGSTAHECTLLKIELAKCLSAIAEALPGIAEEE